MDMGCWIKRGALVLVLAAPQPIQAQIPSSFTNLQYLSPDISRDSLLTVMRKFSFALGVRCQYCHVGGDGISFEGVRFESDEDPDKRKARFMLRLVDNLNRQVLPLMPNRDDPPLRMECKSCHRGQAKPMLLTQELRQVLDLHGADSAGARYRELREASGMRGAFDFGQWEMNTLAEDLAREGRPRDAIAMYRLNAEHFPRSLSIHLAVAELHEELSDTTSAIEAYERVLELRPDLPQAQERLNALRGGR